MKITITILIAGVILSSCGEVKEPATPKNTSTVSQNEYADNSPKDYKAMFGPDYRKGDIGHSTGVIIDEGLETNVVVIEHGMIHGIKRGADTTKFEILDKVDLSAMSSGVEVEFLVKRGTDNIYRLFAICEILEKGKSCL